MFIINLKFSHNKALAAKHMAAHKTWIEDGFNDGIFLGVGSLVPSIGGVLLARSASRDALQDRVNRDPFVIHDVVIADVQEVDFKRTIPDLVLLMEDET